MEEAGRKNNVRLPLQCRPRLIVFVEDIGTEERGLQSTIVSKQSFGNFKEPRFQIDGFAVVRGGTVVSELTDILGEAAAKVDEGGVLVETGQDGGVQRVL